MNIKDYKGALITIGTTVLIATASLLIHLEVSNIYNTEKIKKGEARIVQMQIDTEKQQIQINKDSERVDNLENYVKKLDDANDKYFTQIDKINDNIFQIMVEIKDIKYNTIKSNNQTYKKRRD